MAYVRVNNAFVITATHWILCVNSACQHARPTAAVAIAQRRMCAHATMATNWTRTVLACRNVPKAANTVNVPHQMCAHVSKDINCWTSDVCRCAKGSFIMSDHCISSIIPCHSMLFHILCFIQHLIVNFINQFPFILLVTEDVCMVSALHQTNVRVSPAGIWMRAAFVVRLDAISHV